MLMQGRLHLCMAGAPGPSTKLELYGPSSKLVRRILWPAPVRKTHSPGNNAPNPYPFHLQYFM
jgi:hypothetical protein